MQLIIIIKVSVLLTQIHDNADLENVFRVISSATFYIIVYAIISF